MGIHNPFGALRELQTSQGAIHYYSLEQLEKENLGTMAKLPFSIRILLEAALRYVDGFQVLEDDVKSLAKWSAKEASTQECPFKPYRVILQDFTGVPCVVDLAALRSAMQRLGGDPSRINPEVNVDLVIDHSVQVDFYGSSNSLSQNMDIEFKRNIERYKFLKWGANSLKNFKVVPPGRGIVHQVNLEYLAQVVGTKTQHGKTVAFPDSLVGTDSHTTMINGLGVLGWGVGGIEAEGVMLGQPLYMLIPEVVGVKLTGKLPAGATATDLVLRITEILRKKQVVEKFVEFYGSGLSELSLADRATIANMAPEYGATIGFFPVDQITLQYLNKTGRSATQVELVERYCKSQGLFWTPETPDPEFSAYVELDLATVVPALAGPKRPQDRVNLDVMKPTWQKALKASVKERGFELKEEEVKKEVPVNGYKLAHGSVVIAAITSCTNTSNPSVMLGAGLLAKKAVARGLQVKPYVKTSLAPGSRVVTEYFKKSGVDKALDALGFQTVGYGCTTCIGNSGPLPDPIVNGINQGNLVVAAVLSGNRNFEGRISPHVKANFLASPPLVVAYAIAGTVDIDLQKDPLGKDSSGKDVYLQDIWPSPQEVQEMVDRCITPEMYKQQYHQVENASEEWNQIPITTSEVYAWEEESTYVQEPPFFTDLSPEPADITDIVKARVLVKVGDSVTTDHISPAGSIEETSPAGKFLLEKGVSVEDFNSYGARRGNDRVMTRGTFANIRLKNQLAPGTEGGFTRHFPSTGQSSIYEASLRYKQENVPLLVLAGVDYGMGSSRDWAAKGTYLLGVKAVIATSFERIHRSNLVGMGVLPLQFKSGESHESLGLTGEEEFSILGLSNQLKPNQEVTVTANDKEFKAIVRLNTPVEVEYYRNGGILHTVLRKFLKQNIA